MKVGTDAPDTRRHRLHAATERATRRFGRGIAAFYQGTAINALINLLAVLLGFGIATTWQARDAELRDLRGQLVVLRPLASEATLIAAQIRVMQRTPPTGCVQRLKSPFWESISTSERAYLLGEELYTRLRTVYAEVAAAPEASRGMNRQQCEEFLAELRVKLESLEDTVKGRVRQVEAQHLIRSRGQTSDLLTFVVRVLAWAVAILALPLALYGIGLALIRMTR